MPKSDGVAGHYPRSVSFQPSPRLYAAVTPSPRRRAGGCYSAATSSPRHSREHDAGKDAGDDQNRQYRRRHQAEPAPGGGVASSSEE